MVTETNLKADEGGLVDQYKTATNLEARISLHERFSVSDRRWPEWVFDQFDFPPDCRVMELGCGTGTLWSVNQKRIGAGWSAVLGDFSQGMVEKARANLAGLNGSFKFAVMDAGDIPFEDGRFDVVIANHMLYHVRDVGLTLGELWRVLKPGGRLFASTNGVGHMAEMEALTPESVPFKPVGEVIGKFTLQNGEGLIRQYFEEVEVRRHADGLAVTEVEPLVDYALSRLSIFAGRVRVGEEQRRRFVDKVAGKMAENGGVIQITKDSGLFVARK